MYLYKIIEYLRNYRCDMLDIFLNYIKIRDY